MAVHVMLDLLNSFGVGLFIPFSDMRVELPLLFIVDPVLLALLSAPLILSMIRPGLRSNRTAARAAMAGLAAYLVFCAVLRFRASNLLIAQSDSPSVDREWTYLVPEPLAPFFWKGVYPTEGGYQEALIVPLTGAVSRLPSVRSSVGGEAVAIVRRDGVSAPVAKFLKIPVWEARGDLVLAHDRRFRFALVGNQWDPFTFRFHVQEGRVRRVDWTIRESAAAAIDEARHW
jgi:inner membrane protein